MLTEIILYSAMMAKYGKDTADKWLDEAIAQSLASGETVRCPLCNCVRESGTECNCGDKGE